MKDITIFNAMEGIDLRYIQEASPDAPIPRKTTSRYLRLSIVAAALIALTAFVGIGMGILKQPADLPPVVLPSDESTAANTTPPPATEAETKAPISGSYTTDLYTVEEIDGKHYINFADGNEIPSRDDPFDYSKLAGVYFPSIQEMQRKFLTGDFTETEIKQLKWELKRTEKGFEIFDMTQLYDAVLPEGWAVNYVCMDNDGYSIGTENQSTYNNSLGDYRGEHGSIDICSDKLYETYYEYFFSSYIERIKDYQLKGENTFCGVPCNIYEYKTSSTELRSIILKIKSENKTFDILLKYDLNHTNSSIPYEVHMFGNFGGVNVRIYLTGFEHEPNMDFLNTWGIAPFLSSP
ncbi:MAG: hypothetical protein E7645_06545 [Ruminococcaceae bacterium]|nr:hypothetical protein [Oscillospiraceae bacterium]